MLTGLAANPTQGAASFAFSRTLKLGSTGADVKALQKFLNGQGFLIAKSGVGSPGNETTLYGAKTSVALVKFQEAHAKEILTPSGLKHGTGIFGAGTKAFVNAMSF